MRYYVAADVHGFCTELKQALTERGFFQDTQPHKLILCGDLLDRGKEAKEMVDFVLELMDRDQVILIRGNHEDLLLKFVYGLLYKSHLELHDISNGTVDTVCQLTGVEADSLVAYRHSVVDILRTQPLFQRILPAMVDYYETKNYIFVHGWIPCYRYEPRRFPAVYNPVPDWRSADRDLWDRARWLNGMEAAYNSILEPGKTIVCGHWHCSFGHHYYEERGSEFEEDADFTPYYAPGIVALDACTAHSGKVNCIVLEDAELEEAHEADAPV